MRSWGLLVLVLLGGCSRHVEGHGRIVVREKNPPIDVVPEPRDEGEGGTIAIDHGPSIRLQPIGPALIEVTVADKPTDWKRIDIERRPVAGGPAQRNHFETGAHPGMYVARRRLSHSAVAGTVYAYRARKNEGPWTPEVQVRTPEPKKAPRPPANVKVRADGPYATRVQWTVDASTVAGIEVEVRREPDGVFVRAVVAEARVSEVTHNLRMPKASYEYRVSAFNAKGRSQVVTAKVTMPDDAMLDASEEPPKPCMKLPPEPPDGSYLPRAVLMDEPKLYNDPVDVAQRRFFGEYRGCLRDFGRFGQQDGTSIPLLAYKNEGFPLLMQIVGAGQFVGVQVDLRRFSNGHYRDVNRAEFCGEPEGQSADDPAVGSTPRTPDTTSWQPPFEDCQRDNAMEEARGR